MTHTIPLEPCPFCGGEGRLLSPGFSNSKVGCVNYCCEAMSVAIWNRRPSREDRAGIIEVAARKLLAEVTGLEISEAEIRAAISNTNWSVLQQRATELRAALSSLPEDGWRDMASAKHDVSVSIIGFHGGMVGTIRWTEKFAPAYGDDTPGWYSEALDRRVRPTHWRPLPASPAHEATK